MTDPQSPELPHGERRKNGQRHDRPPFDTSDLNSIPRTTDDDPPYRNWWVVTEPTDR